MGKKEAIEIELSESQRRILTEYAKSSHKALHLKIRSEIILRAADGSSNAAIEREMGINPNSNKVRRWRDRYGNSQEHLSMIERESPHKLRSTIIELLSDEERSGAPPRFRDEQIASIIAMACDSPEKFNLPVSHWTPALLRLKAIEVGIVNEISVRHVGRFLKR
jgi:putative transposase